MAATTQRDESGGALYSVSLALLILALLFGFAVLPRLFRAQTLEGKEAPDFALKVLANGREKALVATNETLTLSELRGQAVLLDFWATWCGPCKLEAPIVNRVAQRFKERGLVVVGVNTSDPDGNGGAWARRNGITYPIVFDEGDDVAHRYGVSNLPTLVLISRTGKILATRTGVTDDDDVESLVKEAL